MKILYHGANAFLKLHLNYCSKGISDLKARLNFYEHVARGFKKLSTPLSMVIRVVEFSSGGYKILLTEKPL